MVKERWASFKEARAGRKDEAQKTAAARDQWKQRYLEQKHLAETHFNRKQRVYDSIWEHRRVARATASPTTPSQKSHQTTTRQKTN